MTAVEHESGSDRARPAQDTINVLGDAPQLPVDLLQAFAATCRSRADLKMAGVVKVVLNQCDDALLFSSSPISFWRGLLQEAWPLAEFSRNIGIYAYRNARLQLLTATPVCPLEYLEKLEQPWAHWLGMKIGMMKWHVTPPHGVDYSADVQRVT